MESVVLKMGVARRQPFYHYVIAWLTTLQGIPSGSPTSVFNRSVIILWWIFVQMPLGVCMKTGDMKNFPLIVFSYPFREPLSFNNPVPKIGVPEPRFQLRQPRKRIGGGGDLDLGRGTPKRGPWNQKYFLYFFIFLKNRSPIINLKVP